MKHKHSPWLTLFFWYWISCKLWRHAFWKRRVVVKQTPHSALLLCFSWDETLLQLCSHPGLPVQHEWAAALLGSKATNQVSEDTSGRMINDGEIYFSSTLQYSLYNRIFFISGAITSHDEYKQAERQITAKQSLKSLVLSSKVNWSLKALRSLRVCLL